MVAAGFNLRASARTPALKGWATSGRHSVAMRVGKRE